MANNSIGIFDSGVGGISIWLEINKVLPNQNTIYLADNAHAPYGTKTIEEIIQLSIEKTEFLIQNGATIIVVACNTATTAAIDTLRQKFNIPFIGIEPAFKPAALNSKTKSVGVLATQSTTKSSLFNSTLNKYNNGISTIIQEGNGLVRLIETGQMHSPEMINLLRGYLTPMVESNIDTLVLGCSHYPFLKDQIQSIIGDKIEIVDSGKAVAKQTKRIMIVHNLIQKNEKATHIFYANGDKKTLEYILKDQGFDYPIEEVTL